MSSSFDRKTVEMRFDNSNFEKNVKQSMSTLSNLKKALSFDGESKALSNLGNAAKSVDMSSLGSSAYAVAEKFSYLEQIAVGALREIGAQAIRAGEQLVKSITVDQIAAGWTKYEDKVKAVQTIMVSTGKDIGTVNDYLNKLAWYADETSYSLSDMTNNIGKFTSNGVDLDKAVNAMMGISNWAAQAGRGTNEAARAMYNLSQAIGIGYVGLTDWRSVELANMGTKQFKELVLETAKAEGYLNKNTKITAETLGSSLKSKWFTADLLVDVLNRYAEYSNLIYDIQQVNGLDNANEAIQWLEQHGDEANDIWYAAENAIAKTNDEIITFNESFDDFAAEAFKAGQEAKTFTDAINAVKDAASSQWASVFESIFGNYTEAAGFWTDVANSFWDDFVGPISNLNDILNQAAKFGARSQLVDSFWNLYDAIHQVTGAISEGFRDIFPEKTASDIAYFTANLKNFTEKLKLTEEESENLKRTFRGFFAILDIGKKAFSGFMKPVNKLLEVLFNLGKGSLSITGTFGDWLVKLDELISKNDIFAKIGDKAANGIGFLTDKVKAFRDQMYQDLGINNFREGMEKLWNITKSFGSSLIEKLGIDKLDIHILTWKEFLGILQSAWGFLREKIVNPSWEFIKNTWNDLAAAGDPFVKKLNGWKYKITTAFGNIKQIFQNFVASIKEQDFSSLFKNWGDNLFGNAIENIKSKFESLKNFFKSFENLDLMKILKLTALTGGLAFTGIEVTKLVTKIKNLIKTVKVVKEGGGIGKVIDDFKEKLKDATKQISSNELLKIAIAIGVLAGSLIAIAALDGDKLKQSSAAMAGLFIEMGVMAKVIGSLNKGENKDSLKGIAYVVALANGVKQLATAMEVLSNIDDGKLLSTGAVVTVLVGEMIGMGIAAQKMPADLPKKAAGILIFAVAIESIVPSIAILSALNIGKLWSAVGAITVIGALFTAFGYIMSDKTQGGLMKSGGDSKWFNQGAQLILKATAMVVLAMAVQKAVVALLPLALLPFDKLKQGVRGFTAIMVELGAAFIVMNKFGSINGVMGAASLAILAGSLNLLVVPLLILGSVKWSTIAQGLTAIGIALGILLVAGTVGMFISAGLLAIASACLAVSQAAMTFSKAAVLFGVGLALIGAGLQAINFAAFVTNLVQGFHSLTALFESSMFEAKLKVWLNTAELLITGLCDVIINSTPKVVEAGLTLFKGFLDGLFLQLPVFLDSFLNSTLLTNNLLVKYVPAIVESFADIIIQAINALTTKTQEFTDALMGFFNALFISTIHSFAQIDPAIFNEYLGDIAVIGLLMIELAGIVLIAPAAMLGLAAVGAFIAEMELILITFGRIASEPEKLEAIKKCQELFGAIGAAIGTLVGSFVGGTLSAITEFLPKIGTDLSEFAENAKPFFDTISGLDQNTAAAVESVVNAILAMTAAEVIQGIASFFSNGEISLAKFGKQLADFGPMLIAYSDSVSGFDEAKLTAVKTAAEATKVMVDLAKHLPKEGGWLAKVFGENDLTNFGQELANFSDPFMLFTNSVAAFTEENLASVKRASEGIKIMVDLAASLPPSGGWMQSILGETTLSEFGDELSKFSDPFMTFAENVKDFTVVNKARVGFVADSVVSMAESMDAISKTGGAWQKIAGSKDLTKFGQDLEGFGEPFSKFVNYINENVTDDAVEKVKSTMTILETISGSADKLLTGIGKGISGLSTGLKDVGSAIGSVLIDVGAGLGSFGLSVRDVDLNKIVDSIDPAKGILGLFNDMSFSDKVMSLFTKNGDTSVFSGISKGLGEFGAAIRDYSTNLVGFNAPAILVAREPALAIMEMLNEMPGYVNTDTDFTGLANSLGPLGEGIKAYSKGLEGFSKDDAKAIDAASGSAKNILDLLGKYDLTTLSGWGSSATPLTMLAGDLEGFAKSMISISTDLGSDFDPTVVHQLSECLLNLLNAVRGVDLKTLTADGANLATLGRQLGGVGNFGNNFAKFSKSAKEISTDGVDKAIDGLTKIAGIADSIATIDNEKIFNIGYSLPQLGSGMESFAESINESSITDLTKSLGKITTLKSVFTQLSEIPDLSQLAKSLAAIAKTGLGDFLKEFDNIQEDTETKASNLVTWITTTITNKMIDFYTLGLNIGERIIQGLEDKKAYAIETANGFTQSLLDSMQSSLKIDMSKDTSESGQLSGIYSALNAFTINMSDNVDSTKLAKANANIELLIKMLTDLSTVPSLETFVTDLETLASNGIEGFLSKFQNAHEQAQTALATLITTMINHGALKVSEFYALGVDLAQGLIDGVSSKVSDAAAAGAAIVAAVEEAIHDKGEFGSPSKLAKRYGVWWGQGWINGLEDKFGDSAKVGKKFVDMSGSSFVNSIMGIQALIDENLDTEPVIRPVLDDSDIVKSAKSISAAFSTKESWKIGADINYNRNNKNWYPKNNSNETKSSTINFTQNNYSPKALSRLEIYRQTRNQLSTMKGLGQK